MTPESNELDRALEAIRNEDVDSAAVNAAAARVWNRIQHATLCSCEDFRALFADFRVGRLAEARTLLVRDHLNECVACRKLYEARPKAAEMPARRFNPWLRWAMAAAAALVVGVGLWSAWPYLGTGGNTVLQAANGTVYQVSGDALQRVTVGAEVPGASEIRTAMDSGAVVRLGDGSHVEMRERSALYVTGAGRDLTVHLARGSIIVQAAKRRAGHLYVATRDCRVAVTGTVFSVNSGVKGSRVSVIEGEVRVAQSGQEKVLHAGDQYNTSPAIKPVPVADEIAWSRDFERHAALLKEFSALQKNLEQVRMPDLRYGSRLLAMLPADTVVYAAIPNLGQAIGEAQKIMRQRAIDSPVLREWWERAGSRHMDQALDEFRAVSDYIGDEIVIAAAARPDGGIGTPVFLAEVKRTGLRDYLQGRMEKAGARSELRIADSLDALGPVRRGEAAMFLRQDLVAVSPDAESLRRTLSGGGFTGTPFGARVAESYRDGAGFVFAADLEKMVARAPAGHHEDRPAFNQLKYAVLEQKESGGRTDTHAVLAFKGARTGAAAWLGKPAAIGGLEFVSPDANFASAVIVNEPAAIFDEIMSKPGGAEGLAKAEAELGINVRNDLLAALGNEIVIAIDGPAVPVVSAKLIAEVRDANRLQWTIQKVVEAYNRHAGPAGKPAVQLSQETVAGRVWYRMAIPGFQYGEADYTFIDGYLIAAPSRALLERAISNRAAGYTLTRSAAFTALMPRDRYPDFSGMVYHNVGSVLSPLMDALRPRGGALGAEQKKALEGIAAEAAKPMLVTFYGEEDRITLASGGSMLGITPANLMRIGGPLQMLPSILRK